MSPTDSLPFANPDFSVQSLKFSLEDTNTWNKFNMTKELEEARKQLKLRDQEILQLRAQVQLVSPLQSPQQPRAHLGVFLRIFVQFFS